MVEDKITIRGAKEHNLKNVDLEIPRNKLVVFTGVSGSGKSSLVFDTIYAEGQRRYMESLSSYARQFLGQFEKPDVEDIQGLSPAISIDQKSASHNPRSTVGTVTEIYDYLRLLFARIGTAYCPQCGREISRQTVDQMVDLLMTLPEDSRVTIMAPVVRGRKGEYHQLLNDLYQSGFTRARINGEIKNLSDRIELARYKAHDIDIVVDRLTIGHVLRIRINDAIETALRLSKGFVIAQQEGADEILMSQDLSCPHCNISLEEISPRTFSFNSPYGACPACQGLGFKKEINPDLVIPDKAKSITDGALLPWDFIRQNYYGAIIKTAADHFHIDLNKPVREIAKEDLEKLLYGDQSLSRMMVKYFSKGQRRYFYMDFNGIIPQLERRYLETESEAVRTEIEKYMTTNPCQLCKGARLKPESLYVKIENKNIAEVTNLSTKEAKKFFDSLKLTPRQTAIADKILKEVCSRLEFLINVGLDYLTLDRPSVTLSGGEAQRIRLASQIGSSLVGVLYVLDEPTIGLHPRDNSRLIETLVKLRDTGNTVLVVEHDEETIRSADYIVDVGPGAGLQGGNIVAAGTLEDIEKAEDSLTGQYLSGKEKIEIPEKRKEPKNNQYLQIIGANEHNLKSLNVKIPLGLFVTVTGVSGSGKSTLVNDILYKALARKLNGASEIPGKHHEILGTEKIDKVIIIDQSPIGRTPRSNPATYTKTFDAIRDIFAKTLESKSRGYQPGRFSFNVPGGRCENCHGDGIIKIEMHFLPDVYVPCEVCKGHRYNKETLEVKWKGKNISQVLDMTVSEAVIFFDNIPQIKTKLKTLEEVGLGYIKLGQSAPTLSGGEAQRVKLSSELSKRATGKTLYILDEPTTGLHFADVKNLLNVLKKLVNLSNTILIIEHNPDIIKSSDWIIDLGPSGGEDGGKIIAQGTPEEVAENNQSFTGQALKQVLKK